MQTVIQQAHVERKPLKIADPQPVPRDIAVCPECDGKLWWQVCTSDGLRDLSLDCRYDTENQPHRNWQDDWEPVYAKVRRWITTQKSA